MPLLLWNKKDLNFIEKKVLGEVGKNKKEIQKNKYKALRDLIEIGDFKFPEMGQPIVDTYNDENIDTTTLYAPWEVEIPESMDMPTDKELSDHKRDYYTDKGFIKGTKALFGKTPLQQKNISIEDRLDSVDTKRQEKEQE